LKIQVNDLSQALKLSIISTKTNIPILAGIKITADKEITLTSTNLEISKIIKCSGKVIKKGSTVVNGKVLLEIFKTLNEAELSIDGNSLLITSGKSKFKIPTMDVKDFPGFPDFKDNETLDIHGGILTEAIEKTIKAVGIDLSRPVLTGALLVIDKDFTLVSTDSYRLAKYSANIKSKVKIEALIPLQSLEEILKLVQEDTTISVDQNLLKVETEQAIFITRLIEGVFPNYDQIIPKDYKSMIICDKSELVTAIKQASLMGDTFIIEDSLKISASTAQVGESEILLDATGEMEKTVFNAQYFLDGLANVKSIEIQYNGPTNPCVLKGENYLYMIMPVRLN